MGGAVRDRHSGRERYCADLRSRTLHGPEGYSDVPPEYRLWIWVADVADAVSRLNLVPAPPSSPPEPSAATPRSFVGARPQGLLGR